MTDVMKNKRRKALDMAVKNGGWSSSGLCLICIKPFKSDNCPHTYGEVEQLFEAYKAASVLRRYI